MNGSGTSKRGSCMWCSVGQQFSLQSGLTGLVSFRESVKSFLDKDCQNMFCPTGRKDQKQSSGNACQKALLIIY